MMTGIAIPNFAAGSGRIDWAAVAHAFGGAGIIVIDEAFAGADLEALRAEANATMMQVDAATALCDQKLDNPMLAAQRYVMGGRHRVRPALCRIIAHTVLAQLCAVTLGKQAFLFTEQFLIKGPQSEMDFNWHQDGAYMPVAHRPFLVVWIPLDDVDLASGTIRAIPFQRMPDTSLLPHRPSPSNGDLVGYHGLDCGDEVKCRAGSIVAFDSRLLHASDNNRSDRWRRVYQIRYTSERISELGPDVPLYFAKHVFAA